MSSAPNTKMAEKFLKFSSSSPTPYHCVSTAIEILKQAGFQQASLREKTCDLKAKFTPNEKFFFTRNQSSIIAFAIGGKYEPGNGATIIAAHTDSPGLQLKPVSKQTESGYLTVGVEAYGGGQFNTWFDRDLSVAGRVFVRDGAGYNSRLVDLQRPIVSVPSLAIHLLSAQEKAKGFKPNLETELRPILAMEAQGGKDEVAAETDGRDTVVEGASVNTAGGDISSLHHKALIEEIAKQLDVEAGAICGVKLFLYDTQKATLGGLKNEFVYAARLDNQIMCFLALQSMVDSLEGEMPLSEDVNVRVVALFDNEEIGSKSNRGADSRLLSSCLEKIFGVENYLEAIENSIAISADMAHAVHPNYKEKHEANHKCLIGKGLVIKYNCNERYATTDLSSFFLSEIAKNRGIPVQHFVARQDGATGSTIGPFISSHCGVRTIDVGIAQLAMHSIREMCGAKDMESAARLFTDFFGMFPKFQNKLCLDDTFGFERKL